ncbi:MAG: FkbM family methyltransferase, partial [Roseimicrobium sp.]
FQRRALLQVPMEGRMHRGIPVATDMEYPILANLCRHGQIVALPEVLRYSRSVSNSAACRAMEEFSMLDHFMLALGMKLTILRIALKLKLPAAEKRELRSVVLGNFKRAPFGQAPGFTQTLKDLRREIATLRAASRERLKVIEHQEEKLRQGVISLPVLKSTLAARDKSSLKADQDCYWQESDLAIVQMLARHCENRTFIDVGAGKGFFTRSFMDAGFHGALFEPFPSHHEMLAALVNRTAPKLYPFAIDATDHEGGLHVAHDAEGKVMDNFHSLHHDEQNPNANHKDQLAVTCRSLASLHRDGLLSQTTGILKIDTEGTDLHVMQGLGELRAEVLICEFVTPGLYPTWVASFPEALIKQAFDLGYEECIVVKRFAAVGLIGLGEPVVADGQWGSLIFTSRRLFLKVLPELQQLAKTREGQMMDTITADMRILNEKEACIQFLVRNAEERDAVIHDLKHKLSDGKAKMDGYRNEIARQKAKNAELQTRHWAKRCLRRLFR